MSLNFEDLPETRLFGDFEENRLIVVFTGLFRREFEYQNFLPISERIGQEGVIYQGGGMADEDDWETAWDSGVYSLFHTSINETC
jgi:hypothetical protein